MKRTAGQLRRKFDRGTGTGLQKPFPCIKILFKLNIHPAKH